MVGISEINLQGALVDIDTNRIMLSVIRRVLSVSKVARSRRPALSD